MTLGAEIGCTTNHSISGYSKGVILLSRDVKIFSFMVRIPVYHHVFWALKRTVSIPGTCVLLDTASVQGLHCIHLIKFFTYKCNFLHTRQVLDNNLAHLKIPTIYLQMCVYMHSLVLHSCNRMHMRQSSLLFFAWFVLSADDPRKQRGSRSGPTNKSILTWIRAIWHIILYIFFCFRATLIAG